MAETKNGPPAAKASARAGDGSRRLALDHGGLELGVAFSVAEYASRLKTIRAEMARRKIDLLYLTAPESIYYLSGYQAVWYQVQAVGSWLPISGIAVHVDGDDFIQFDNDGEESLIKYSTIARDARIWDRRRGDFLSFIVKNLKDEGWLKGTVALELRKYRPSRAASEALEKGLLKGGAAKVVDGTDIVDGARSVKSPQEMLYTRTAARLTDLAFDTALSVIRPGVSEWDIYAEVNYAMMKAGGEPSALVMMVNSGQKILAHHAMPSRRKVMPGDIVNIDCCGVYHRYHSNIARSIAVGTPDRDVVERMKRAAGAFSIVEKMARPGQRVQPMCEALKRYYKSQGLWGEQWWTGGYEIGCAFAPDWVGAFGYDVEHDNGAAVFREGMVINYESDFYFPRASGMTVFIDTYLLDQGRAERPHRTPLDLLVVE